MVNCFFFIYFFFFWYTKLFSPNKRGTHLDVKKLLLLQISGYLAFYISFEQFLICVHSIFSFRHFLHDVAVWTPCSCAQHTNGTLQKAQLTYSWLRTSSSWSDWLWASIQHLHHGTECSLHLRPGHLQCDVPEAISLYSLHPYIACSGAKQIDIPIL